MTCRSLGVRVRVIRPFNVKGGLSPKNKEQFIISNKDPNILKIICVVIVFILNIMVLFCTDHEPFLAKVIF